MAPHCGRYGLAGLVSIPFSAVAILGNPVGEREIYKKNDFHGASRRGSFFSFLRQQIFFLKEAVVALATNFANFADFGGEVKLAGHWRGNPAAPPCLMLPPKFVILTPIYSG